MATDDKDIDQGSAKCIDPDFMEIRDFIPVRTELIELLKYWFKQFWEWKLFYYATGADENKEFNRCAFRGQKILVLLPEEETEKAFHEAKEEFKNQHPSCFAEPNWVVLPRL